MQRFATTDTLAKKLVGQVAYRDAFADFEVDQSEVEELSDDPLCLRVLDVAENRSAEELFASCHDGLSIKRLNEQRRIPLSGL